MEKLTISEKPSQLVLRHAGSEVLRVTYPEVSGDTAAARHAAAMIGALVGYAKTALAPQAAAALAAAAKEKRLFAFRCHRYDVTFSATHEKSGLCLRLTAAHRVGTEEKSEALVMLFDSAEALQLSPRRASRTAGLKTRRRAHNNKVIS